MSANNIVVIKKEADGKFRGYHRDMDAYCEGQYDHDGVCQFCLDGCEMCNYTKQYTSPKENPIFEVDTIEEAIHAYNKWCQDLTFVVEYGYQFEGLEPNEETVKAMEETDKGEGLHAVESVNELVEELNKPSDTELLDFLQLITNNAAYTGKVICRASTTGRGWRLHETSKDDAVPSVYFVIENGYSAGRYLFLQTVFLFTSTFQEDLVLVIYC